MKNFKLLKTNEKHSIAFKIVGDRKGIPIVFIHGGPGSECPDKAEIFFEKNTWFCIFFDQRGCGSSTPRGYIKKNTTQHIIHDMEKIRKDLGIKKWVLFGGSWGSTIALKYATEFPEKVLGMVLRGIFLGTKKEINWFIYGLKKLLPNEWAKFTKSIPKNKDILNYYHEVIFSNNEDLIFDAAKKWSNFENSAMNYNKDKLPLENKGQSSISNFEKEKLIDRIKIHLHYLKNFCFLKEDEILKNLNNLKKIKIIIVQGQDDVICPPHTSERLFSLMPWSKIIRVKNAGHSAFDEKIKIALINSLNNLSKDISS